MSQTTRTPVIQTAPARDGTGLRVRLAAAMLVSFATHAVLLGLFLLVGPAIPAPSHDLIDPDGPQIVAEGEDALPRETFDTPDIDPTGMNLGGDIVSASERSGDVTLPGPDDPRADIGLRDGLEPYVKLSYPTPPGFLGGNGGTAISGEGRLLPDEPGGGVLGGNKAYTVRGGPGGSGSVKEGALKRGGGNGPSEAAVNRGLRWLARQQSGDGRWMLDGMFKDKGSANDTAGTGLGLLPFLGAGKTHKASRDNEYDKTVRKGLSFLIGRQDPKRGELGGGMYGHGIATIALCEAYGLTQAPNLRRPAQMAVNYIVHAQHEQGGWRYSAGQAGDVSVTGWQIMALKSAQMAGLDVPSLTLKKAERFLDSQAATNEGYGYTDRNATPTMSAVGLLSRQFMQVWGPRNPRLIRGIDANVKPTPPGAKKDAYYYYYATQVMFHFGGDAWKNWNGKMRDLLVKTQEDDKASANFGSWSSDGDVWGRAGGGRLMVTSLNLLTLEVYYRYLPLYFRDLGVRNEVTAK
jgi:hypothetical protein